MLQFTPFYLALYRPFELYAIVNRMRGLPVILAVLPSVLPGQP